MSIYLLNETGEGFHFDNESWRQVLHLARLFGWQPAGTLGPRDYCNDDPTRDPGWAGSYDTSDCQLVTAADGRALADAVERSLPDIPDHDAASHKLKRVPAGGGLVARVAVNHLSLLEWFSGLRKLYLRAFICFARAAEFEIR